MMAKMSGWIVLAFVAGLWVGSFVFRGAQPVGAQSVDDKTTRWLAASVGVGGDVDVFTLFDSQTQRLLMYRMDGDTLRLMAVRDVTYDLKPIEYPDRRQVPAVLKMKELYDKDLERREPPEKEPQKK